MANTASVSVLVKRLEKKIRGLSDFTDKTALARLERIARLLESRGKINVRKQKLVDTGNLMNSIKARVISTQPDTATIEFGSFGVIYAKVHEFGFDGPVVVTAHTRLKKNGGVTNIREHVRQMSVRPRPYIRPAIAQSRDRIRAILLGNR